MTEEDDAATKPWGRARGGWAARIEQFGGVVRPVLYLAVETWTSAILEGCNVDFFLLFMLHKQKDTHLIFSQLLFTLLKFIRLLS